MKTANSNKKILPEDAKILHDWMQNLPYKDYNKVRKQLLAECLIPSYTLSNWMNGNCKIRPAAKRDINRVTMAVSGKEIFTIAEPGKTPEGASGTIPGKAIFNS